MQGASRAALSQAQEELAQRVADPAVATTLSEELFAVTDLLDGEPGLRRALTDATSPQGARSGLVRGLLGGRVSRATLDLVTGMVTGRWSHAGDLADATERLAVFAAAAAADDRGSLDDVEDEMFRFGRILGSEPELHAALSSPRASADAKRVLLERLLAGKVSDATLWLATRAALRPRGRSLEATLAEYSTLTSRWRERMIAVVRVAAALTEAQRQRLASTLSDLYGHSVQLNVILDPKVVGGMSIHIGDEVIDGSVSSRLAALRRRLAA